MAYLDGEMKPAERKWFEFHLDVCRSCRHEVESRRPIMALLAEDTAEVTVPAELTSLIRAGIRQPEPGAIWRTQPLPRAAMAVAAVCFLLVGVTIGFVAGGPEPGGATLSGTAKTLPEVDETDLYQKILAAQAKLIEAGKEGQAGDLEDVGRLLENIAVLKGGNAGALRAMKTATPVPAASRRNTPQPTSPEELRLAYQRIIEDRPSSPEAATARVKLAEHYYDRGEWRQAHPAYALYKLLHSDHYLHYAHRDEVDHRLELLAESQRNNFKTLDLYRQASESDSANAFDMYSDIILWQPAGNLAKMAVLEMAQFGWQDGRLQRMPATSFATPEDKVTALQNLIADTYNSDVRALAQTTIGDIYRDELGDVESATLAYHLAVEKYPRTLMASKAKGRLNRLDLTSIRFR